MTTLDIANHLSPGQASALEQIEDWYQNSDQQVFRMFGPAGTGKTTVARLIPDLLGLDAYYFGAFSGKAVNVLRTKGCIPAYTLHRLMYGAPINLKAELKALSKRLDEAENVDIRTIVGIDEEATNNLRSEHDAVIRDMRDRKRIVEAKIRNEGGLSFDVNIDSPLKDCQLLIADEVSMVGDKMVRDMLSFGGKVLVLGDPFQLAPVRGEGTLTKADPDVMLHEVHRQALDSPVLSLATRIRNGDYEGPHEAPRRRPWHEYDQILTWRRKTRWGAVRAYRELHDRPPGEPVAGDRVMCLANNSNLEVFNGQTWVVLGAEPGRDECERKVHLIEESDDPSDPENVWTTDVYVAAFCEEDEKPAEEKGLGRGDDDAMLATFANALTVHKAQGSEWGSVLVMDETGSMRAMESMRSDPFTARTLANRWLYTAVTRAANEVALVKR